MKISDNISRPRVITIGFTSRQLCFLEPLFRLPTQDLRITILKLMPLVIVRPHITQNNVGCTISLDSRYTLLFLTLCLTWMHKLKKLVLQSSVDQNVVEDQLKIKAADSIAEPSSSKATDSTADPSKPTLKKRLRYKRPKKKANKTAEAIDAGLIECDNIFVTGCDISVGTAIKRAAYNLHEKSQPISCRERKIMTSGLSSILDLSDDSFGSQRSLFTGTQWAELHSRYDPKFDTPLYKLESDVTDFLKIACGTLETTNDVNYTLKFLRKAQEQLTGTPDIALKLTVHILGLTHSYNYLLTQNPNKNVTELDYYCTIWSPMFLILFPPSNSIRVKSGESINSSSTLNKKELYNESTYVRAFKIDFRFLTDIGDEEYDVGVGECAINSSDTKAIKDDGKLTREAKDALDMILKIVEEKVNTKMWTIQTSGSSCSMSMLDIFDVGLYDANYKYSFDIPTTADNFIKNIITILQYLLTMQRDVVQLGNSIVSSQEPEPTPDNSFNRNNKTWELNTRFHFIRDTYYTPPKRYYFKAITALLWFPSPFNFKKIARFVRKGLHNPPN